MSQDNTSVTATAAKALKYTACLIEQSDKDYLVDLRKRSGYTEKELLAKVVEIAKEHDAEIVDAGQAALIAYEADKKERATIRYETIKQAGKEARAAARVMREHQKATKVTVEAVEAPEVVEAADSENIGDIA